MSGAGNSFSHVGIHVGADWHVRTATYPKAAPMLDIDAGASFVSISLLRGDTGTGAVGFARALAREAQRFADEIERMHAAQSAEADATKAAGTDAA